MKKLMVLVVLALSLALWVMPAAAITFGELDTEHTNVGAMVVLSPDLKQSAQWCSGTLIHERIFLTAGHCIDALDDIDIEATDTDRIKVNFDEYALNKKTMLDVEQVIIHPDFYWGPQSNPHDVAVLVLEKSVKKKLKPAILPTEGFLDDLIDTLKAADELHEATFTAVGYGVQEAPEFKDDGMRRVAESEYQGLLKFWLRTSQNRATGDSGHCFGDSGGPIFWMEPDGSEILVGLISWGDAQCKAAGFNYRVDIPETLGFINEVIASLD